MGVKVRHNQDTLVMNTYPTYDFFLPNLLFGIFPFAFLYFFINKDKENPFSWNPICDIFLLSNKRSKEDEIEVKKVEHFEKNKI